MEKEQETTSQGKTLLRLNHSAVHLGCRHKSIGDKKISALATTHQPSMTKELCLHQKRNRQT
jgi:hypothetical protein